MPPYNCQPAWHPSNVHGKKAKPFFQHCLISLVFLHFAYFYNPNLVADNCLWVLPWSFLCFGWLLATLSFHLFGVVFSCFCVQRTHDPQGSNWVAAEQSPLAAQVHHLDCSILSTTCCLTGSPFEFKLSARSRTYVKFWLVIKNSLGEMSTLHEATRNHTVYCVLHKNCAGKCILQVGEREGRNRKKGEGQRHLTGRRYSVSGVTGVLLAPILRASLRKSSPAGGSQPSCSERSLSRRIGEGRNWNNIWCEPLVSVQPGPVYYYYYYYTFLLKLL